MYITTIFRVRYGKTVKVVYNVSASESGNPVMATVTERKK